MRKTIINIKTEKNPYWIKVQLISDYLYKNIKAYDEDKTCGKCFDCWDVAEKILNIINNIEKTDTKFIKSPFTRWEQQMMGIDNYGESNYTQYA